jgi:hypothetical protein
VSGLGDFKGLLNQQIGYPVQSDGTTKYGRDYSTDHNYWDADFCDMGLSWVAKYSGNGAAFGHFAYVPSHRDWFIANHRYTTALAADQPIFFDWNGNGVPNHIGWLESFTTSEIHTVEFNHERKVGRFTRPRNSLIMGTGVVDWPSVATESNGDFYIA